MQYKFNNKVRNNNKAISDIVAVVMLILIAIAAAVLIYLWLSGLVGSVHTSNPALTEKIEITAASITFESTSGQYNVSAYVQDVGSSPVTINGIYVYYANSSALIFGGQPENDPLSHNSNHNHHHHHQQHHSKTTTTSTYSATTITISPGYAYQVWYVSGIGSTYIPSGTPVIIEVTTTNGVQATYQTAWP